MAMPTMRKWVWTRESFERVVDVGGFDEDDRVELLDGELWEMSPPGSPHTAVTLLTEQALRKAVGDRYQVRRETPFALDETSQPQPDIALVPGTIRDYYHTHPTEAVLLVEISDSTLRHDRERKLAAYARNGIPEYWIVDLKAERVEVYREPVSSRYRSQTLHGRGERVPLPIDPSLSISVNDLFL